MRRTQQLVEMTQQLVVNLETIRISLERLDAAIITRYPDSTRAAEEYAALRRGVMTMASSSSMNRHNLISLVNAIDEGASASTVRGRIVDLLTTQNVSEVLPEEAASLAALEASQLFQVVGDEAHPRSAWILTTDDGIDVLQKGHAPSHHVLSTEDLGEPGKRAGRSHDSADIEKSSDAVEPPESDEIPRRGENTANPEEKS